MCATGIPLCGINHIEGHISAIYLSHPAVAPPFLALVVSGGHTAIYRVDEVGRYTRLGRTVDDAAGEAFDKAGKMLGFPDPAGRAIEEEARSVPLPVAAPRNPPLPRRGSPVRRWTSAFPA